jgi:SAM-dependent methyltransferase
MQYDPIKRQLGGLFNRWTLTRKLLFRLLDILLLRTWHVHRELRRFFRNRQGQRLSVLDAGSGFGQYTYYVARRQPDWTIRAIDLKEEEIANSRDFFQKAGLANASFATADLLDFQEPGTFDLVLSVDVMEHIEQDVKVFTNLFRSMKPGAMLLISTPSDQGGSGVGHGQERSFIEEHVRDGYGRKEIADKLRKAGFGRVEARYTYGPPGNLSWWLSMRIPITLVGYARLFWVVLPFYYLLVMPPCLLLNLADLYLPYRSGTGLLVKAWKT